jgi:hypothetical protein
MRRMQSLMVVSDLEKRRQFGARAAPFFPDQPSSRGCPTLPAFLAGGWAFQVHDAKFVHACMNFLISIDRPTLAKIRTIANIHTMS